MAIGRNDVCLCGSGKKYKKCCSQKDIIAEKEKMLEKKRKYMEEFALHTYTSYGMICYPNKLKEIRKNGDNFNYHIYMINQVPKLTIIRDSIVIEKERINLDVKIDDGEFCSIEPISFSLDYKIDHHEFNVILDDNEKDLIVKNNLGGGLSTNVLALYSKYSSNRLHCKVLYIGQAYGRSGKRTALDRLTNHEKMIEILGDTLYSGKTNDIAITLWEFTPRLIASIDGISKKYVVSPEDDEERVENILAEPPLIIDNQIINITEAALINYFKPIYNERLKDNFPDVKHKGYRSYYEYDYNSICVELDVSAINLILSSEKIPSHNEWDFIEYNLDNDKKRKDLFEIFK